MSNPFPSNIESTLREPRFVRVFADGEGGGNPAPVVLDASGLDDEAMMGIARRYAHESAFVFAATDSRHLCRLRFFVPNHEMEMCGHATLGALWLMRNQGIWRTDTATVETLSGLVDARWHADSDSIEVSQPVGKTVPVTDAASLARVLDVLGIEATELLVDTALNASTSRVKTLVPLASVERLQRLAPDFARMQQVCDEIGSTGLYPFAVDANDRLKLHARQFPRASGYAEDAATGIAAAALLYGARDLGLLRDGDEGISVAQGEAMGKPSRIGVTFRAAGDPSQGCWLSGTVYPMRLEPVA